MSPKTAANGQARPRSGAAAIPFPTSGHTAGREPEVVVRRRPSLARQLMGSRNLLKASITCFAETTFPGREASLLRDLFQRLLTRSPRGQHVFPSELGVHEARRHARPHAQRFGLALLRASNRAPRTRGGRRRQRSGHSSKARRHCRVFASGCAAPSGRPPFRRRSKIFQTPDVSGQ